MTQVVPILLNEQKYVREDIDPSANDSIAIGGWLEGDGQDFAKK